MVLGLPRHGSAALCVVRGRSLSGISPCFARLVGLGVKWSIGAHLIRSLRGAQSRSGLGLHRSLGERVRRRRLGLEVDEGWCREVTDVLLRRLGRVLRHLLLDPVSRKPKVVAVRHPAEYHDTPPTLVVIRRQCGRRLPQQAQHAEVGLHARQLGVRRVCQ